jgi:MFS family permease
MWSAPAGRHLQLLLLMLAACAMVYARNTLGPLQEAMRAALALSDNQVAWLQGPAIAVPMALGSIPLGLLADRHSRVRLLLYFTGLDLAANVLTVFAFHYALLIIARCFIGLAQAALIVAVYSLVADLYSPAARGRANMAAMMGEVGGSTLAFALGGILLTVMGPATGHGLQGWRWALLWTCLPLIPVLLLLLLLREPPRTGVVMKNLLLRGAWPLLWQYRRVVLPLLFARMLVWIADGAVVVWGAPMFSRKFGLPPDRVGALMGAALLIGGISGALLGGSLADYCQRRGGPRGTMWLLTGLSLVGAPLGLFALMPGAGLATVMLAAFLATGYIIATAAITMATIVIPGELRGLYLGLMLTLGSLCFIGIAPLAVSGLSGILGGEAMIPQSLAIVCTGMSLVGAAAFAAGTRFFPGALARKGS